MSPPPTVAPHGGDDPARLPGSGQGAVEALEIGVTDSGTASLILKETLEEITDAQDGGPDRGGRPRFRGVEWGVEKNEASRELFWLGHVTNIALYGGYVTPPLP